MQSSYRIVPAPEQKSASTRDSANALGLHDTLHYGPVSLASNVKTQSTVRDRLENVRYSLGHSAAYLTSISGIWRRIVSSSA
jgi:hypothetical protein